MRNKKGCATTVFMVVVMILFSIVSAILFVDVVDMPSEEVCDCEQREADC